MAAKITTRVEGETITHRVLWQCCKSHFETANRRKRGGMYFHLSAMLMAYFSYEAYLNFLGDRVAPDIWVKEKQFFGKDPYRGNQGKLRKLSEICHFQIDPGKRPMQTIVELENLRDFVAHGKPDKYTVHVKHHPSREVSMFGHDKLGKVVTKTNAQRALKDVEQFMEYLHSNCRPYVNDLWFGDKALSGILGFSSFDAQTTA